MHLVQVRCPYCSNKGYISISEDKLSNAKKGLLTINVSSVCVHTFFVYVDKNLNIRDYFKADFQLENPKTNKNEEIKNKEFSRKDLLEFDLIKENVNSLLLSYAIKSILLRKKVLIIIRKSYFKELILNFFHYLTQDAFTIDISLLSKGQYTNEKEKYQDYMVLEQREILNNVDNLIDPNDSTMEKQIVRTFLFESNLIESLNTLKSEILKLYNLSKSIAEFFQQNKKGSEISSQKLSQHLKKITKEEISSDLFHSLLEIAQNYFGVDIIFK